MKITKTEKVVTEEIEILPGTYYFKDNDSISHKFILKEPEEDCQDYSIETLYSFSNRTGIDLREDYAYDEEDLPYVFKQFILLISGQKIEKEDYYKERAEILEKLR